MTKDLSYSRDAVLYNEALADAAEKVAEKVEHPTIKQWATSVGKQHRFHENRHRKALAGDEDAQVDAAAAAAVDAPLPEGIEVTQVEAPSITEDQAAYAQKLEAELNDGQGV